MIYITVISWAAQHLHPLLYLGFGFLKILSEQMEDGTPLMKYSSEKIRRPLEARIKLLANSFQVGTHSFERHSPTVSPFASQSNKAIFFCFTPKQKILPIRILYHLLAKSKFLHLSPAPDPYLWQSPLFFWP